MDEIEPFVVGHLPFRYKASAAIDRYVSTLLGKYRWILLLVTWYGTPGQHLMQLKQKSIWWERLLLMRLQSKRIPLIEDVLWLLYIQGLCPIMSLEHFKPIFVEESTSYLGYITPLLNIGQFYDSIIKAPSYMSYYPPPHIPLRSIACHSCHCALEAGQINRHGQLFCDECAVDTIRPVYFN